MSTSVMMYGVRQVPDPSPSLAVYPHPPSSTTTLAAVTGLQLMMGNEDDLSAFGTTGMARDANFVPAKLFTTFGKLPNTPVCLCVKR